MRVADEALRALAGPLHRPAELARRPQADDLLGIDEDLRAEAAADIGRDHAQLVLGRHADERGDHQPGDVRVLRCVPQRQVSAAGIVFGDCGARLHRIRHQPVVDELELGDVLGVLERGIGRVGVADVPVVDRVVRRRFVNERRALGGGLGGIDDRGQHLVIDHHLLGRVLGLRQRIGDHDGDRVADVIGLAGGDRRVRRHLHRRAVLRQHGPAADQIAELVLGELRAGEHAGDAGHAGRGLGVDVPDLGVRVRRADEIDRGLARPADVVGVVAFAGDEAMVFLAAHWGADTGRTHGSFLRRFFAGTLVPLGGFAIRRPSARRLPPGMARAPAAIALTIL